MKIHEKLLYSLVALLLVWAHSCNGTLSTIDDDGDPPPPPPPSCDQELEPNDYFTQATFVDVFPVSPPDKICGSLPFFDTDFFYFYLSPASPVTEIYVSVVIVTDPDATLKLSLFQTVYDSDGYPTGAYTMLGQFVDGPGMVFVNSFPVPYDMMMNNDLFMTVEDLSLSFPYPEYELEYWSN